ELGDVIIDVFVAVLGVEVAGEAGGFVSGDLLRRALNIIADLIAGFVSSTAGERKLIGGGAIASTCADLGAIFVERILKCVSLHQHVDLPLAIADLLLELVPQLRNRL